MNKKFLLKASSALALGALLGLGVTACGSNSDADQAAKSSQVKKKANESKTKTKIRQIKLSQTEALNKFDQKFKDAKIKSIDLKLEGQDYVYEIEGADDNREYEATIDAQTGKLLHSHSEKLDLSDRLDKTINFDKVISRNEATKIAEREVSGTAKEWNLEQDHSKSYWEIRVSDGKHSTEVKIDAESKEVVKTEEDD